MSRIDVAPSTMAARARESPMASYVATIMGLALVVHIIWDPEQTGTLVGAVRTLLPRGLILGALLGVFLLPAATLTLHLANRWRVTAYAGRAALGIGSWLAWYLATAGVILLAKTIGLWPEGFVALLSLVALAVAVFGLLAIGDHSSRPSRPLTAIGVTVATFIVVGCFLTAGWWGFACLMASDIRRR